jgi:hypothetical protein
MQRTLLTFVLVASLENSLPAQERTPPAGLIDGAQMFSAETKLYVQKKADEIRAEFKIDVCIETVTQLKDVDPDRLRYGSRSEKKALASTIHNEAINRADAQNVRGLFVLILKNPPYVKAIGFPSPHETTELVSWHKRGQWEKDLHKARTNDLDRALRETLEKYAAQLSKPRDPSPLPWFLSIGLVALLASAWAGVSHLRTRFYAPEKPLPIYQPALIGCLFGTPASLWITDRLFALERPVFHKPMIESPEVETSGEPTAEQPSDSPEELR